MIRVQVTKKQGSYQRIFFQGHALYEDFGKDIVCAGVSAILITTVNAILSYDSSSITYQVKENVVIEIHKEDEIIRLLFNNMMELLKELEQQYPKNISIREDENNE